MDVYRIFKPVIYISRLFCLAPFAAVEDSDSTRYKFSIFWLIYSILGVCATLISQINVFWFGIPVSQEEVYNVFTQVTSAVICVPSLVAQLLCLNSGKNVIRILDNVSGLDSEHSGARIRYYRLYVMFIVHLVWAMISFAALNGMFYASLDTNSVHIFEIVYYYSVFIISDVVMLLSDTLFIHFVLLLKHRFSVLNDTVMNFTVQSLHKTSLNHMIRAPAVDRSVNSSISAVSSSCIYSVGVGSA
jgi:hypothetical protein